MIEVEGLPFRVPIFTAYMTCFLGLEVPALSTKFCLWKIRPRAKLAPHWETKKNIKTPECQMGYVMNNVQLQLDSACRYTHVAHVMKTIPCSCHQHHLHNTETVQTPWPGVIPGFTSTPTPLRLSTLAKKPRDVHSQETKCYQCLVLVANGVSIFEPPKKDA